MPIRARPLRKRPRLDWHGRVVATAHSASLIDLPPNVAKAFVKDMRAYFAEENRYKQDQIALRQLHALKEYQLPRRKPLRLSDIKSMFQPMMTENRRDDTES